VCVCSGDVDQYKDGDDYAAAGAADYDYGYDDDVKDPDKFYPQYSGQHGKQADSDTFV